MFNPKLKKQTITIADLQAAKACNVVDCAKFLLKFLDNSLPLEKLRHEPVRVTSQLVARAHRAGVLRPWWFARLVMTDQAVEEFGKLYDLEVCNATSVQERRLINDCQSFVREDIWDNHIRLLREAEARALVQVVREGEREARSGNK